MPPQSFARAKRARAAPPRDASKRARHDLFDQPQYVDGDHLAALSRMFCTHPSVQAPRSVLQSHVMQGDLGLYRDGRLLPTVSYGETDREGRRAQGVTDIWAHHLQTHWRPFARDVLDAFMMWGLCPVAFVPMDELNEDEVTSAERGLQLPVVPRLGTFEITWNAIGRYGYARRYALRPANHSGRLLYASVSNSAHGLDDDEESDCFVAVHRHPDANGRLTSALATAFDTSSFVSTLLSCASSSEQSRSRATITTQIRRNPQSSELSAGALFVDTETREALEHEDSERNARSAQALRMQAQLCQTLNRLQGGGGAPSQARDPTQARAGEPLDPKLFTLPHDHEIAPQATVPTARGDLVDIMRYTTHQFCSAMGVPPSLVFEGQHTTSTAQLALLNSTIQELSECVSRVLTKAYRCLYQDDRHGSGPELRLDVPLISSTADIVALANTGLLDAEVLIPVAMRALSLPNAQVLAAVERLHKGAEASAAQPKRLERPSARPDEPAQEPASEASSEQSAPDDEHMVPKRA
jgi:hypothetical protein